MRWYIDHSEVFHVSWSETTCLGNNFESARIYSNLSVSQGRRADLCNLIEKMSRTYHTAHIFHGLIDADTMLRQRLHGIEPGLFD